MTDDPNNPRKLALALRMFERGAIGHRFSRQLTPDEGERLRQIILSNGHGSCIFVNAETRAPVGAWLCVCEECEMQLLMLAGDAKISVIAQVQGENSYVITGDDTIEIRVQQIGVADQARLMQTASVAQQVAAQIAAEVAAAVANNVSQKVAHATVVETLGNVAEAAASDTPEQKVTLHYDRPN